MRGGDRELKPLPELEGGVVLDREDDPILVERNHASQLTRKRLGRYVDLRGLEAL
jgi:hypothetical protein